MKRQAIYSIGDLITELEDRNLNIVTGLITNIYYNDEDGQYSYYIKWSDMTIETLINEAIVHWRIQNDIWKLYKVLR